MICIQLKIKCKIILLKTLENELNKSYFMTYHTPQSKFCWSLVNLKTIQMEMNLNYTTFTGTLGCIQLMQQAFKPLGVPSGRVIVS